MNKIQRILLAIYLPITLIILILDNICSGVYIVKYIKYAIMITLFLWATSIKRKTHEQRIMNLALFFVVVADFFLVFSTTIPNLKINRAPFGIAGFFFAYLCLIVAYQKNFKIDKASILSAIPATSFFIYVFSSLQSYVKGLMLIGVAIFGVVLCYMTWTSICTIFRKYYNPKIAFVIAVSGILMFICDMGVAYTMFDPQYSQVFVPWLENIIWASYIPGWTLLTVVISEEKLLY